MRALPSAPMSLVLLGTLFATACASEDYARLYHTADIAPSLTWESLEALEHMGPTIIDDGVNFSVYSARATRMELLLFDDPESDLPTQQFELSNSGDVWNIYVEGVGPGPALRLRRLGPELDVRRGLLPGLGHRLPQADVDENGKPVQPQQAAHRPLRQGRPSRPRLEPRAPRPAALPSRPADLRRRRQERGHQVRLRRGHPGRGDRPGRRRSTTGSDNEDAWRQSPTGQQPRGPQLVTSVIVYEVQPQGHQCRTPASNQVGVEHFGTYRGASARCASVPGKTSASPRSSCMPIHEKPLDGGYWGYNNISYFAPEVS